MNPPVWVHVVHPHTLRLHVQPIATRTSQSEYILEVGRAYTMEIVMYDANNNRIEQSPVSPSFVCFRAHSPRNYFTMRKLTKDFLRYYQVLLMAHIMLLKHENLETLWQMANLSVFLMFALFETCLPSLFTIVGSRKAVYIQGAKWTKDCC